MFRNEILFFLIVGNNSCQFFLILFIANHTIAWNCFDVLCLSKFFIKKHVRRNHAFWNGKGVFTANPGTLFTGYQRN
jgi:hypothetical protein